MRGERLGCGDVSVPLGGHSLAEFGKTASVEGPGDFRVDLQCLVVIGDRLVELVAAQVYQPAAVEELRCVRIQPQARVAVAQGLVQLLPEEGACPTALVVRLDDTRILLVDGYPEIRLGDGLCRMIQAPVEHS